MKTHDAATEHARFDAICAEVEDYQKLPAVEASPPALAQEVHVEERVAPIDELILAGLVSP